MSSVLIVEDDLMIADFLEEILIDAGYTVCGIATTLIQAVKLGNAHRPDLAVMDLRLGNGDFSPNIVPLLTECSRIGILYATGNDNTVLTLADGQVCIRKPYLARELLAALQMVQQIMLGSSISALLPRNARVLV